MTRIAGCLSLTIILLNASCSLPHFRSVSIENAAEAMEHYNRGRAFFEDTLKVPPKKREYDKAIGEFSQALRIDPGYAEAYRARAYVHHCAGRNIRAIDDYSQAIRREPGNARGYYFRGWAYAYSRKFDKAIDDYNRVIKLKPGHAGAWYNRGLAYKYLGKTTRAEADMDKARELGFKD